MARGCAFHATLSVGGLVYLGLLRAARSQGFCSQGSCAGAALTGDEEAGQSGVHLLQRKVEGLRPVIARALSDDSCWDLIPPSNFSGKIYLLHIPKTAICTVITDLTQYVDRSLIYSAEGCYDFREKHDFKGVMTLLRNPRSHVLSQYFECSSSDDWWIACRSTCVPPFRPSCCNSTPERFDHFVGSWATWHRQGNHSGRWTFAQDPFSCYRPVSLQATRFTCSNIWVHPERHNVTEVVSNMMNTEYLGLVEAYQESICLFLAKLTGELPSYCDCRDAGAWGSFVKSQETHGSTPHSLDDYSEAVLADIDSMTFADRELYRAAVNRFQRDVQEVERQFGTQILCRDLAQDPSLQYVFASMPS